MNSKKRVLIYPVMIPGMGGREVERADFETSQRSVIEELDTYAESLSEDPQWDYCDKFALLWAAIRHHVIESEKVDTILADTAVKMTSFNDQASR